MITLDLERLSRLREACKRVNIITEKDKINSILIYEGVQNLLTKEEFLEWEYFLNNIFEGEKKQFYYHLKFLVQIPLCDYCNTNPKHWYYKGYYQSFCEDKKCLKDSRTLARKKQNLTLISLGKKSLEKPERLSYFERTGFQSPLQNPEVQEKKRQKN